MQDTATAIYLTQGHRLNSAMAKERSHHRAKKATALRAKAVFKHTGFESGFSGF
jgi:hypothetical protein